MKRLMTLAVAFAAAMMVIAAGCREAETEKVGGYTWTYRINGDKVEIGRRGLGDRVTYGDRVAAPIGWISSWLKILTAAGGNRERALNSTAANGWRTVSECYALGLNPMDATNDLCIVSIEMVDGVPHVEWKPKVNRWTGMEIRATLKGAVNLDSVNWSEETGQSNAEFMFFNVEVV